MPTWLWRDLMSDSWTDGLRAFAAERQYRASTVDSWLALARTDGEALLRLAEELRLGENQLRDLWVWAEEIALRDRTTLAGVIECAAVAAARRRAGGRAERLKGVKQALRRLRFPQLAAQEARLAALVEALELPPTVRVRWPEFLEGDTLRFEFEARDPEALGASARALLAASARSECAEIFALLDGGGA